MSADLIVVAAAVRTMERSGAAGAARVGGGDVAVAVSGGRVLAVGAAAEVLALRNARTEVREVPGGCVLPGFHDAHVHLGQHGLELDGVDLADAATLQVGLERIAERAGREPAGRWILGSGFSLERWGVRTLHKEDLDRVAPDHPVYLRSQDHHAAWVNSAALRSGGVGRETPDPEHGVIERDADGGPSGYLLERAGALVAAAVPAPDAAGWVTALTDAGRDLAARGVTTVHHMAYEPAAAWRAIADAASRDHYPVRVWACIPHADLEHAAAIGLATGQGGDGFTIGGAKFFADGALGSRTAWMLEPYRDGDGRGMAVDGPELLAERFGLAIRAGFAPVTHAIGDAAVRAVLDALEPHRRAYRERGLQPRIEHAQHVHPSDVPRFGELGVVASMQPIHLTFDAPSIRDLLADRLDRAYPMRELLAAGAVVAFGSDTPVAPPDVLAGMRAAVRREDSSGAALEPERGLDVGQALAGWTLGAASAIGRAHRSGTLSVGADADLVVLDHDPVVELDDLAVRLTVKGGRVTFEAP
jgi:predicted amidohydrolase YtcJ